ALEDRCSHEDYELSAGPVDPAEGSIECVLHGARFDLRDGRALCAPAYSPVAKFPVRVDATGIWTRDDRDRSFYLPTGSGGMRAVARMPADACVPWTRPGRGAGSGRAARPAMTNVPEHRYAGLSRYAATCAPPARPSALAPLPGTQGSDPAAWRT